MRKFRNFRGDFVDSISIIWQKILNNIETEISPLAFATWIKPLRAISFHDGIFLLEAKDDFAREQSHKYKSLIENALLLETNIKFSLQIISPSENKVVEKNNLISRDTEIKADYNFSKKGENFTSIVDAKQETRFKKPNFNPRYTFDRFIVGDSNQFAHAACLSVAQNIGHSQNNPLFIYGGSGLGKTHLMHAIGNYLSENEPNLNMIYVTCEEFMNEFISAIKRNNYEEFRNKYRKCNILFIDDIQIIEGKDQIQIEFFNTFNSIYENGSNIVITCDKPPQSLSKLEERLKTRFSSGLIVDVKQPSYETRVAILEKIAFNDHIMVTKSTIDYIAEHIKNNVRELEGAFKNVVAYASLGKDKNVEISVEDAIEALKSSINPSLNDKPSSELIIQIVCNYFNLTKNELLSKNKKKILPRLGKSLCIS